MTQTIDLAQSGIGLVKLSRFFFPVPDEAGDIRARFRDLAERQFQLLAQLLVSPRLRIYAEGEKGHQDRFLPLTPDCAEFLQQTLPKARRGLVFRLDGLQTRSPISPKRISRIISAIGEKAGVVVNKADQKFASAHDLRRAFGTRWAARVKPNTLRLLMRHRSIETTLKYYVDQDADDVADLRQLERRGKVLFLPFGGDNFQGWDCRLAALNRPEFHLLDRESPPATARRIEAAKIVNERPACSAAITAKRSIENYLDPEAIFEARQVHVEFSDDDDVADVVAHAPFSRLHPQVTWTDLPPRSRRRLRNRAKGWLNTAAVDQMTVERFLQRDQAGEIVSWLEAIRRLADGETSS